MFPWSQNQFGPLEMLQRFFILIGAFLCELFVCGKLLNTLVENDSSPIHLEERGQTDGRDGRDGREIDV